MKYVMCVVMVFATGFSLVASGEETTPAKKEQAKREQLRIVVQQICPVSGKKLGSMGAPVKIKVGKAKEEVYLCCKGCAQRKINPQHWATIHANIAKAQRICPIMENGLPKDAKSTVVRGQIVYVCCPPCTKKIEANATNTLRKIDGLYTASLRTRRSTR